MENEQEKRAIIAENLANLRKKHKLTQSELALKFGYSDKAISKREKGDTLPDIITLSELCEFYNISIDILLTKDAFKDNKEYVKNLNKGIIVNNAAIELLACSFVWILASIIYIYLLIFSEFNFYQIFIWALPITCLVMMFFQKVWKLKIYNFVVRSLFFWTLITACYIQFIEYNVWPLFILMIPIQVALILGSIIKDKIKIRK